MCLLQQLTHGLESKSYLPLIIPDNLVCYHFLLEKVQNLIQSSALIGGGVLRNKHRFSGTVAFTSTESAANWRSLDSWIRSGTQTIH